MKMLGLLVLLAAPLSAQVPNPCLQQSQARFSSVERNVISEFRDSVVGVYVTRDSLRWRCVLAATTPVPPIPPSPPTPPAPPNPPTPPSGSVVFFSDFSTALGTSREALTDGGKWPIISAGVADIIPSAGLDFPTANVLRITSTNGSGIILRRVASAPVGVGQSVFYRWYQRQTHPPLSDNESHPVQDGNAAGDANWMWKVYHSQAGLGRWIPQFHVGGNPYHLSYWTGPPLDTGVTYRIEVQVHRLSTTQWNLHARVYVGATQLLDDRDFTNDQVRGSTALLSLGNNPGLMLHNVGNLGAMNVGLNGIASPPPQPFVYGYQSGVAICASWCGPR